MRLNPHGIGLPIYSRANMCNNLLDAIPLQRHISRQDRRRCEGAQNRFHDWIDTLQVWDENGPNLDSLLDPSKSKIRHHIEAYLRAFHQLLSDVLDASRKPETQTLSSEFEVISKLLKQLQSFTYALLFFTDAGFGWRVEAYQREHDDPSLNQRVIQYITAQYPPLNPAFRPDLPRRWRGLGMKVFEPNEAAIEKPKAPVTEEPNKDDIKMPNMPLIERPAALGHERGGLFKALVDAVLFTHYKTRYIIEQSPKDLEEAQDPEVASWRLPLEPSPVIPENHPRCPVCQEPCSQDSLGLTPDMCHFMHIVKPYVCIDEKCCMHNLHCFETAEQWKAHMNRYHSRDWVGGFQRNVRWSCRACTCISPTEFESVEPMTVDLIHHLHDHHGKSDDDDMVKLAHVRYLPCDRDADTCPLCGICYSVNSGTDPKTDTDSSGKDIEQASTDSVSADVAAVRQVNDCVARHMLELCLEFIGPVLSVGPGSPGPGSPVPSLTSCASSQSGTAPSSPSTSTSSIDSNAASRITCHSTGKLSDASFLADNNTSDEPQKRSKLAYRLSSRGNRRRQSRRKPLLR